MWARLTWLNAGALLLLTGIVGLSTLFTAEFALRRSMDDALRSTAEQVNASSIGWDPARQRAIVVNSLETGSIATETLFVQAVDSNGAVLARSASLRDARLPMDSARLTRAMRGETWLEEVTVDQTALRMYAAPLVATTQSGARQNAGVIEVGRSLDALDRRVWAAGGIGVLVSAAIAVPLALAMGALLTHMAMAPLELVAATLRGIDDENDLSQRVDLHGERLHPTVRKVTAELNRMLGRLEAAAERVDEVLAGQRRFVADASHELRTPLTSLRGNIDLLRDPDILLDRSEKHAVLVDMGVEASRMSRMVNDLLLLAEADAGQHLELQVVDLLPLVRRAARNARWLREDVALEVDEAFRVAVWMNADPDRLSQLFLILFDNALKFSPARGRVCVQMFPALHGGTDGVRVDVADQGPGVPPAERERIFERFYRASDARAGDGSGLGLAIAQWIVQEHHGTLDVRDNVDGGATFSVWLPTNDSPD